MYFYRANAHALGGTISRPSESVLETQASVSLPTTGGCSCSEAKDFNHKGLVTFKSARVEVNGSDFTHPDPKSGAQVYSIRVSAVIEELNILDMVTADRVVARLTSEHAIHPTNPKQSESQPSFIPLGSSFENLRIAGQPVEVEYAHGTFAKQPTYEGFKKRLKSRDLECSQRLIGSGIAKNGKHPHLQPLRDRYDALLKDPEKDGGMVLCSIVKSLKPRKTGELEVHGSIIVVPHFGTIYLGEILLSQSTRLMNMLRLEMGSPDAGSLAVGFLEGTGTGYPPQ
jgi:hypothetical protein